MDTKANIWFRVDASPLTGIGHIMRCIYLADRLIAYDANITFLCRSVPDNIKQIIKSKGYFLEKLKNYQSIDASENINQYTVWLGTSPEKDADEIIQLSRSKKIDWMVVDHYAIDASWHSKVIKHVDRLMVIDDLANRKIQCDILLDQTLNRERDKLTEIINDNCYTLLGSDYALISDKFSSLRIAAIDKRKKTNQYKHFLISLGGVDDKNYTCQILQGLERVSWRVYDIDPHIDIVLSGMSPSIEQTREYIKSSHLSIRLHVDVDYMHKLVFDADIAIGAGGISSWERCCLGLPSIILEIAENQKNVVHELVNTGAALKCEISDLSQNIKKIVEKLNRSNDILREIELKSFNICDGKGAGLVAINMLPKLSSEKKPVTFRKARLSDTDMIFEWQSDARTRKFSNNTQPPEYGEHTKWMKEKLEDSKCFYYIIEHDFLPAGAIRLDACTSEETYDEYFLVSIYIAPAYYRKGIAGICLSYIKKLFENSELKAQVHPDNKASNILFKNAGFTGPDKNNMYLFSSTR